uniref:Uncharacterized protein n=1 Tax=Leersia perrieri TaxID=77586 RepID=A0A0D9X2X6_9ORYZ
MCAVAATTTSPPIIGGAHESVTVNLNIFTSRPQLQSVSRAPGGFVSAVERRKKNGISHQHQLWLCGTSSAIKKEPPLRLNKLLRRARTNLDLLLLLLLTKKKRRRSQFHYHTLSPRSRLLPDHRLFTPARGAGESPVKFLSVEIYRRRRRCSSCARSRPSGSELLYFQ